MPRGKLDFSSTQPLIRNSALNTSPHSRLQSQQTTDLPLVRELHPAPDVGACLSRLAGQPHCLLLDSASRVSKLGRYSFLAADPIEFLSIQTDRSDPLAEVRMQFARLSSSAVPELPPFQGGLAGVFSYDLNRSLERIRPARFDEFDFPAIAVGLYDVVIAWDHQQNRAWLISQGWPETDPVARRKQALDRLAKFESLLHAGQPPEAVRPTKADRVPAESLAPQFAIDSFQSVTSSFSRPDYLNTVEKCIEFIRAGDIFQVNLAQRLLAPHEEDPVTTYLKLRAANPAPFAGFFDVGSHQLLSASPERFVKLQGNLVETRPIKGTRRRTQYPEADLHAAADLLASDKDRAENVMIVDLLRNDLSCVCEADSVQVTQLCELEIYQYVQHLVSVVQARLKPDLNAVDLIAAMFPGGSITGAPKFRAMEIISELEPTARGAYCGCMGYISADGTADLNILIRTMTLGGGWCQFPVGGGIVADSQPLREYEETWDKAIGMLSALR